MARQAAEPQPDHYDIPPQPGMTESDEEVVSNSCCGSVLCGSLEVCVLRLRLRLPVKLLKDPSSCWGSQCEEHRHRPAELGLTLSQLVWQRGAWVFNTFQQLPPVYRRSVRFCKGNIMHALS